MGGSVPFEVALASRLDLFKPSAPTLASFLANRPPRWVHHDRFEISFSLWILVLFWHASENVYVSLWRSLEWLDLVPTHWCCGNVWRTDERCLPWTFFSPMFFAVCSWCRLNPGIGDLVSKLHGRGTDVYLVSGGFRQMIEVRHLFTALAVSHKRHGSLSLCNLA